ncbi:family 43 glycosylhydrolase [Peribacillus sp. SCS-26]|uniref:family 43 glycosylhydrolase n=1 Tax=Paraperibacillus marinus TaxID=3115295 RepID=UPI003905F685
MNKRLTGMLLAGVLALSGCSGQSAEEEKPKGKQYKNPVFEPVIADPSIIKGKDGYYYAYGTEDNWGDGKGPRYVPVIRSKNLVKWDYAGEAFEAVDKPNWKEGGIWAPDISYYKDQYYLYYSMSTWGDQDPGVGVAVSSKPEGPFTDKGEVLRSQKIGVENSIDPAFYNDNGTPYLFWGSFHGIYGVKLTEDGMKTAGKPFQVGSDAFEAPYIVKRDGYYYLFLSSGSCCEGKDSTYHVAVGRSKSITGPYLDQTGADIKDTKGTVIMTGSQKFAGPGHNAVITDEKGRDWMIYHAIDVKEPKMISGITRRPLMIDPITWKKGWPVIKNQEPGSKMQDVPVVK